MATTTRHRFFIYFSHIGLLSEWHLVCTYSSFHMVEIKRVRAHGVRDSMLYSILFDVAMLADGSRRWGPCCGV